MIRPVVVLLALAAPAHVEPQVSEAPAGSPTTFSFLVEHGCGDSPTVEVAIQIPEGAFDIVPVAPAGWTGAVEPGAQPVVRFTGGSLPADVEGTFGFELVTPNLPGQTVLFPTVQTCEEGEIAWIDPADEAEEPAPRVVLTENPDPILPTTTTTAAPTTTSASEAAAGDGDDGGDVSSTATVVTAATALAAAAAAALVATRRRAARHP